MSLSTSSHTMVVHDTIPAVILTLNESFSARHVATAIDELVSILDASDRPLFYVNDIQGFSFNFGEMVMGMAEAGRKGGVLRHPNLAGVVVVTENGVARLGASALSQIQYGGLEVQVCQTIQEALDWVTSKS